jgi:hypothetical protein
MGPSECRFELRPSGEGNSVRFLSGSSGPIERPFDFALSATSRTRRVIADIDSGVCRKADLQDVGSQLWNALCPPGVREAFEELARAATELAPLKVWLDIPLERQVDRLPWEALHDERGRGFFCANPRFCILRAPSEDTPEVELKPPEGAAIRMLVVIPEGSNLQVQHEWSNLQTLVSKLGGALEAVPLMGRVTPDRLEAAVKQGPWDILHFIGHGEFDESDGVTVRLNQEQAQRGDFWMDAPTFAALMDGGGFRLALLNCCLGASPSISRNLSGLGPHLMRTAHVAAVVAMRYEIADSASIRFSDSFYRELLTGNAVGRVDVAVQRARRSLFINGAGDAIRGFITPVLYHTTRHEQLFQVRAEAPPVGPATKAARAHPGVPVPESLVRSLQEGLCIPVVGPGLHQREAAFRKGTIEAETSPAGHKQLIQRLAAECEYPEHEDLEQMEKAGEWLISLLLARVCQYYQRDGLRFRLINSLLDIYKKAAPPPSLLRIAQWEMPGIFYTHVDGLMEEALKRAHKLPKVINLVQAPQSGARATPLLVNVRGSLGHSQSLVLTESDHDRLLERLANPSMDLVELVRQTGRSLLFLGASPRDPVIRRLTGLLETGEATTQGPCFFVSPEATEVDRAYWRNFNVEWIREEPAAVIESLTVRLNQGKAT